MPQDTKTQLLDAAEHLFAEQGFKATSLRQITARAGANLAAVNYHFGGKDGLVEAVLARRLRPMNQERIHRLEQLQAEQGNQPLLLNDLVRAFVGPPLEMSHDQSKGGARFIRLLGRSYSEPDQPLHDFLNELYAGVVDRFRPAFALTLPELSAEELRWRLHFMVGLLSYVMAGSDLHRLIASRRSQSDAATGDQLHHLVVFVCGGMRANDPDFGAGRSIAVESKLKWSAGT